MDVHNDRQLGVAVFCRQLHMHTLAGVLDEPFSQLTSLSGVAVQARQSSGRLEPCPSYVAWRAGMATQLSGLSRVRFESKTPITEQFVELVVGTSHY